jgi:plastocyanin
VSAAKVAGALALLLFAACGDGGSDDGSGLGAPSPESGPGAGTSLTVEAHDIDFDRDAYRIAAGPADIEYVQEGALPHSLVIEAPGGGDVDGFKLEVGDAGADRGTVDLPAGDYLVYCDVPGHRDAGMEAELHVE